MNTINFTVKRNNQGLFVVRCDETKRLLRVTYDINAVASWAKSLGGGLGAFAYDGKGKKIGRKGSHPKFLPLDALPISGRSFKS